MKIEWEKYHVRLAEVGRSVWPRGLDRPPGRTARNCEYSDMALVLFTGGSGRISMPAGFREVRRGICVWLRPGWAYESTQDPADPLTMDFIHFDLITSKGRVRPWGLPMPPEWMLVPDLRLAEAITGRLVDDCFGYGPIGYTVPQPEDPKISADVTMFTGLLMALDAAASEAIADPAMVVPKRLLKQIAARILADPRSPPSVKVMAQEFGYSTNHFIRLFRESLGLTPKQFVIQIRLRRARQLLSETDMPVGTIADQLGYADVFFFSKQFKHQTGVSPLQYRKKGLTSGDD